MSKNEPTRTMTPDEQAMVRFFAGQVQSATKALDRFRASLADNPAWALEWAESAIDAAATLKVATQVVKLLQEQGTETARGVARTEALRGARWPHKSTSAVANATLGAITAAWAEAESDLGSAQ